VTTYSILKNLHVVERPYPVPSVSDVWNGQDKVLVGQVNDHPDIQRVCIGANNSAVLGSGKRTVRPQDIRFINSIEDVCHSLLPLRDGICILGGSLVCVQWHVCDSACTWIAKAVAS
jgi:hypothetical protein